MKFKSFFLVIVLFLFFNKFLFSEEIPKITVEPYSFSKIVVKVSYFEGDKKLSYKLTPILIRLLNYHIFILASSNSPLIKTFHKEYLIKGVVQKKGNKVCLVAELWDKLENKVLESYKIEGPLSYPYLVVYSLCNKVIEKLSNYKGLAFSKIVFVKRTSYGDKLYISDFSKVNPHLITTAPLILFPKFSPQGDKLAYLIYKKRRYFLEIYDLKTHIKKSFFIKGLCSTPVWSSDGEKIFLTIENKSKIGINEFNIKTGILKVLLRGEGVYQVGSVSKDGRFLAYVYDRRTGKPKIYLLDLNTLKSYRISKAMRYNTSPRFSPKGDYLLYLAKNGGYTFIVLYNLHSHNKKEIVFPGSLEDPAFSPTGDYIIAYGKGPKGTGLYLIHLDSNLSYLYIKGKNFLYPDWSRL